MASRYRPRAEIGATAEAQRRVIEDLTRQVAKARHELHNERRRNGDLHRQLMRAEHAERDLGLENAQLKKRLRDLGG